MGHRAASGTGTGSYASSLTAYSASVVPIRAEAQLIVFRAPQAALAELCTRVVEATQRLLRESPSAESQAIPANEQMKASAMVRLFNRCDD
jgi:hypothetical protein